jgi:hypothetical protein
MEWKMEATGSSKSLVLNFTALYSRSKDVNFKEYFIIKLYPT